jgi:hypothetical protein
MKSATMTFTGISHTETFTGVDDADIIAQAERACRISNYKGPIRDGAGHAGHSFGRLGVLWAE